jgi:hypothetical protein
VRPSTNTGSLEDLGSKKQQWRRGRYREGRLDETVDNAVQRVVASMRHGTLIIGWGEKKGTWLIGY